MTKEEILAQLQADAGNGDSASEEVKKEEQLKDGEGTDSKPKDDTDYKALYEQEQKDKQSALVQKAKLKDLLLQIAGEGEEKKPTPKVEDNEFLTKEDFAIEKFKLKYSDLSDEDVDTLNKIAKATGKTMEETMETPIFKAYIDKITDEKGFQKNIPKFQGRSSVHDDGAAKEAQFKDFIISKYPKNMQKYFTKKDKLKE